VGDRVRESVYGRVCYVLQIHTHTHSGEYFTSVAAWQMQPYDVWGGYGQ